MDDHITVNHSIVDHIWIAHEEKTPAAIDGQV